MVVAVVKRNMALAELSTDEDEAPKKIRGSVEGRERRTDTGDWEHSTWGKYLDPDHQCHVGSSRAGRQFTRRFRMPARAWLRLTEYAKDELKFKDINWGGPRR